MSGLCWHLQIGGFSYFDHERRLHREVRSTCFSVCCFSTTLLAGFEVVSNNNFCRKEWRFKILQISNKKQFVK